MFAVRYNWWNLGLVGMVFGGWIVYVLWTLAARERRFSFEPLYCPVCNQNRSMMRLAFWGLLALAPVFALAAYIAASAVRSMGGSPAPDLAIPGVLWVLCATCVVLAFLARSKDAGQVGVRLRAIGEEDAGFAFLSPQYAESFTRLNAAFVRREPVTDELAEAESFIPGAALEGKPLPPTDDDGLPPPANSDPGPPPTPPSG